MTVIALLLAAIGGAGPDRRAEPTSHTSRIEVHYRVVSESAPPPGTGVLNLTSPAGQRIELPVGHEPTIVTAERGSTWTLDLVAAGWWSAPRVITFPVHDDLRVEIVEAWRSGTITGRLIVPTAVELPSLVTVKTDAAPGASKRIPPGSQLSCKVAKDGRWSCTAPAATIDIVIRATGYVPHYRWDVRVPASGTVNIGDLTLQSGASVVVWLDRDTLGTLKTPARATLLRLMAPAASHDAARLQAPVASDVFNRRGMVQLAAVPPGTYILEVSAPGFASTRVFPTEVYRGSETLVRRAVKLDPPVTLAIVLKPAADPNGRPWHVTVVHLNDFSNSYEPSPATGGTVSDAGQFAAHGLAPGTYLVTIEDDRKNVFERREIHISAGRDADETIAVPTVSVRGKVVLAGTPLPATLWFGGRHGRVAIKMTADEEGNFAGSLPRHGKWLIEVIGTSVPLTAFPEIETSDRELLIEIPDTRVRGVVIAPEGGVAVNADVTAIANGKPVHAVTGADGRFEVGGLPPGTIVLSARDGHSGRRSNAVKVETSGTETIPDITLELQPSGTVAGQVVSRGVPVIGARISGYAFLDGRAEQSRASTDEGGFFQMDVPSTSQQILLVVSAPSKTLQAFDLRPAEEFAVLDLAAAGGTVILEFAGKQMPMLTQSGRFLPPPDLLSWVRGQGGTVGEGSIRVPNLAPAFYRACISNVRPPASVAAHPCAEGTLAPGGTLTLKVEAD